MARLNEAAPPPVESVDALKRRFVRQNRELTKANTTQSLRIRTLELETSRLLSENLSLRSQIIALQHQSHQHQSHTHAILTIKNQLEKKLEELGRLVCELGDTTATDEVPAGVNRGPARSPDPKNWKNALTLSDVAQGHRHGQGGEGSGSGSGRLPVILEDKYYPRRTMNAEELITLLSGPGAVNATASADSPDLGPPPVAHFEAEEVPIRFDPSSMPQTNELHAEQEEGDPVLSANLETRKRRKDGGSNASDLGVTKNDGSAYGAEKSRSSSSSTGKEESGSSQYLNLNMNPSAKRKLSVREGEEAVEEVPTATGKDDFLYNHRPEARVVDNGARDRENNQDGNVGNAKITGDLPAPRGASRSSKVRDGTAATTGTSVRKALEPKSANTDPASSPTKNGKQATVNNEKIPDAKKDTARKGRERERHRERDRKPTTTIDVPKPAEPKPKHEPAQTQSIPPPPPPNPELATDLPPETPASLDLFSPQSSTEPSAARPDSRDTPPPSDLNQSTADAFNPAARTSRRPRAGLSYAEPNLRDKMRRPTKALADAVGAEERVQRAISNARAGSESRDGKIDNDDGGSAESAKMRTVVIKKENVASEQAWKSLPSASESGQLQQQQQQQRYRAGVMTSPSPLDDRALRTAVNGNGNGHGNANEDGDTNLPPSVMTARRHRGSSVHRPEGAEVDEPNETTEKYPSKSASASVSVGGTTIAALVAGTARRREKMLAASRELELRGDGVDVGKEGDKDKVLDDVTETEKLDIYDFHDSEPADPDGTHGTKLGSNGGASRASRRHSAMPMPSSSSSSSSSSARHTGIASSSGSCKEDLGVGSTARPRPSSRSTGRRRGTLGLDGAQDERDGAEEGDGDGRVAKARSVVDLKNGDVDVGVRARVERGAGRRRSMML